MVILIICSIFYLCLWISGEGESGPNGESSINVYTLSGVRWIAGEKSLCNMEALEGWDVCIITADLHCFMTETSTAL